MPRNSSSCLIRRTSIFDKQVRDKQPYLEVEQASNIAERVIDQFKLRTGTYPSRLVIHKTSRYQPEEISGFHAAGLGKVPSIEMVWMRPTGFRLISDRKSEVERGMFIGCRTRAPLPLDHRLRNMVERIPWARMSHRLWRLPPYRAKT